MRRIGVLLSVAALVLAGLVAAGRARSGAVAQEATAPAGAAAPLAGVTLEMLDQGEPGAVPGKALLFARVTLEPGGYVGAHGHPGAQIWYVDAGTVGTTVLEGTVRLTRAAAGETPAPAEQLAPGDEVTMSVGDSLFFDRDVVHTVRNAGDETAVILIPALFEAGEPPVIFHHEGTHAP